MPPEDWLHSSRAGDRIVVERLTGDGSVELFRGYIGQEGILIQSNPDAEAVSFTAYGPELLLRNKVVRGQWHKTASIDDKEIAGTATASNRVYRVTVSAGVYTYNVFQTDLPVIFNQGGKPNASAADWALVADQTGSDAEGKIFESPNRVVAQQPAMRATHWTAYTALWSLLSWYDSGDLLNPDDVLLHKDTLNSRAIGQVVVEGMTLLDAIKAILVPIGYGFSISPWHRSDGTYPLRIFPLHADDGKDGPSLADTDNSGNRVSITSSAGQRASVERVEFLRDSHNVRNQVTVVGDMKRTVRSLYFDGTTSAARLQPNWDTTAIAADLDQYDSDNAIANVDEDSSVNATYRAYWVNRYCRGGKDALSHWHTFRTFALNDDGWMSHLAHGGNSYDVADFSSYGIGDNYAHRARPMGQTFMPTDGSAYVSTYLPAHVTMSLAGVANSTVLIDDVDTLTDHCGFTINIARLDKYKPYAFASDANHSLNAYKDYTLATLLHNTLRGSGQGLVLHLWGSTEHDESLTSTNTGDVDSAWPFTSPMVVYEAERFRYVSAASGLTIDSRDDTDDIADFASRIRNASDDSLGHGSIVLRHITRTYKPGMAIKSTRDRRVTLRVDGGSQTYCPVISRLTWNFAEGANKTEVVLDSSLLQVMA